MRSLIRLFRAAPISSSTQVKDSVRNYEFLSKTIKEGFIFSPEVIANYADHELVTLFGEVKQEIGLNGEQLNNAFHKSWAKVRDASMEQLVTEQIIHYLTTYGFEALGLYNKDSVYIPQEALHIPALENENLQLIVIHGYTKEEIKEKLLNLLNTGIALKDETVKAVVEVAQYVALNEKDILQIKNKEVKAHLFYLLQIVPENPTEFLRAIVFLATEKALLIKDKQTLTAIKEKQNTFVLSMLLKYEQTYGLERLAEIFYRFKPLFLAFRTSPLLRTKINKIRKLAVKHHEPLPVDFLNNFTANLDVYDIAVAYRLADELKKVNIFRKIRLAYALKFRTTKATSVLYKIRNGKGYATAFEPNVNPQTAYFLDIVLNSIVKDMQQQVAGKRIYIPENIVYALPATEKQFTGMFPSGTYVKVPQDMIFGVHWENVDHNRIDLDLSLVGVDKKYGWDASYRDSEGTILFSGDMTDAPKPNGASELFYVQRQSPTKLLLMVNYFNYEEKVEVPLHLFVAEERIETMQRNYMVNPNNMLAVAQCSMNKKQKILGIVAVEETETRFYFSEAYVGNTISSSDSPVAKHIREYLYSFHTNSISLNELLVKAGAIRVSQREEADIDLSPSSLTKDSIIKLLA